MKNKRTLTALVFAIFIVSCSFFSGCGIINNPGSTVNYKLSWTNPLPQGNTLQSVFFIDADNAFAVGEKGSIIRYSSGSWTAMQSNTTQNLFKVWAYDVNNVFAVGSAGTVMRYDGNSWSSISQSLSSNTLMAVWGLSPTDLYAGSNDGTILHFNGSKWTSSGVISEGYITGILGFSANNIYAISNAGEILRYNGSSWSVSKVLDDGLPWLTGIWADAADNIYVCATSYASLPNNVFHFDGTSWTGMGRVVEGGLNAIWGTSSNNLIVSGDLGLTARYDGSSWRDESKTIPEVHIYGVCGDSENKIFSVGDLGMILENDGSSQWTLVSSPLVWSMRCIWGSSSSNIFAGGSGGTILHFDGTEWTKMDDTGVFDTVYAIWGTSHSNVYAVGGNASHDSGFIIRYDGTKWNTVADDLDFVPYAMHGTGQNDIYVAGKFVMHFNGTLWSDPNEMPAACSVVWSDADQAFAAGENGLMMYLENRTTSTTKTDFTYMNSGTCFAVQSIFGFSPKDVFMGDTFGNLLLFDGTKWSVRDKLGQPIYGIWGTSVNNMYLIVGYDILHWDGVSYRTVTSIATHPLYGVWGAAENDVFFAGHNGTILRYGPR
jgi:hypothetical protein